MASTPHLPPSYGRWDAATMLTSGEREYLAGEGFISFQPHQDQAHLVSLEQDRQAALQKTQMEHMMRASGRWDVKGHSWAEAFVAPNTEVTDEMRSAARLTGLDCSDWGDDAINEFYKAMHGAAKVELVPEGERIAVKERDKLLKEYKSLCERHAAVTTERDALEGANIELQTENMFMRDRLTFLEEFYRAAGDLVKSNEPAKTPFPRVRGEDRRRMGWIHGA